MPAHQRAQMPKGSRKILPEQPACSHPASTSGTQGQVSSRPQGVGKNAPKRPQPAWCWARAQVLMEIWILSRQAKTSSRHSSGPLPGTGWGGADTIAPRCRGRHLPICSHDSTMPAHGIPRGKGQTVKQGRATHKHYKTTLWPQQRETGQDGKAGKASGQPWEVGSSTRRVLELGEVSPARGPD